MLPQYSKTLFAHLKIQTAFCKRLDSIRPFVIDMWSLSKASLKMSRMSQKLVFILKFTLFHLEGCHKLMGMLLLMQFVMKFVTTPMSLLPYTEIHCFTCWITMILLITYDLPNFHIFSCKNIGVRPFVPWMDDEIRRTNKRQRGKAERTWRVCKAHVDVLSYFALRNQVKFLEEKGSSRLLHKLSTYLEDIQQRQVYTKPLNLFVLPDKTKPRQG